MSDYRSGRAARAALLGLAVLGGAFGLSAAQAQSIDVTGKDRVSAETRSIQVAYGDLNLASVSGRDQLERRIRWAAQQVCGGGARALAERVDQMTCGQIANSEALGQARQVAPALAAVKTRPAS